MGEIAESMLNGYACEMCGVPLDGEGFGAPRYFSKSCREDRLGIIEQDDESAFWRRARNIQKQERAAWRDKTEIVVRHKLNTLIAKGHRVQFLTPWQVRVDGRFDLFWQAKRYHDIKENRWGNYFDIISFIESKTYATEPRLAPRAMDGRHHGDQ